MAKDPAFLFYYQDFLVGVDHMSLDQIGAYIICLCHQAHRGSIRPEHMLDICKTHDNLQIVRDKFKVDENGEYFNVRLREAMVKRLKFTESRRQNRLKHMSNTSNSSVEHMENENENISNKLLASRFESLWLKYPKKDGKRDAFRHFKSSVKSDKDFDLINKALDNYCRHASTLMPEYIKAGKTWFYNWSDWVDYEEPMSPEDRKKLKQTEEQIRSFENANVNTT
jgi:hypothetical protein